VVSPPLNTFTVVGASSIGKGRRGKKKRKKAVVKIITVPREAPFFIFFCEVMDGQSTVT